VDAVKQWRHSYIVGVVVRHPPQYICSFHVDLDSLI
jgi:hypothetical protein